jgi:hypothetical protein
MRLDTPQTKLKSGSITYSMKPVRKWISSWTRERSTRFAHDAQQTVFKLYVTKYIQKYIKLHAPNATEHHELAWDAVYRQ